MTQQILTLAKKDLLVLTRDRVGFFFVLGFPLIYAVFFGLMFRGAGDGANPIAVLIVDEDQTEPSKALVERFRKAPEIEMETRAFDDAVALVRKGRKTAYIRVPKGYAESAARPFWGGGSSLELGVDPSRKAEAGMLQGVIMQHAAQDMFKAFTDPEAMRKQTRLAMEDINKDESLSPLQKGIFSTFFAALDPFMVMVADTKAGDGAGDGAAAGEDGSILSEGWQPVKVDVKEVRWDRAASEFPNNPMDVTFPQSLVWGLMGCAASFGISLVVERSRGTLVRLRLAPLARWHVLAGKGAACFIMLLAVTILLLLFAMIVFGVRPENYAYLAMGVLCAAICFTGIMMMLAVAGRTEASAGGIGWAVLIVMAMLGGGMMPLFFMPAWMRSLASISPVKWTVLALEGPIFRGYTFGEMMLPCGVLVGVGLTCFAAGSTLFARMEAK
ncbi:MAG: ABC transporter permease [Phycisphaerales bacterium]|nr:ABC transporter permease [Phycisphaerales bacterium]